MATDLEYVPLPDAVKAQVHKQWGQIKDTAGKALLVK